MWLVPYGFIFAEIEFEQTPLFNEVNFAPGQSVSRSVTVSNDHDQSYELLARAFNVVDSGELSSVMNLRIESAGDIFYEDTFHNFFDESEVILLEMESGESKVFDFIATLESSAGNEYQNSEMGFNLEVGFEGAEIENDTIAISGSITGGGGGSSGDGFSSGPQNLIISGESAVEEGEGENAFVTVSWDTNIPATSQVVYGLSENGPYTLDLDDPNFGYPFSTGEFDLNKVIDHQITLENLEPGIYSYRVISRASPPTVGYERQFVVANDLILIPNNSVENSDGDSPSEQGGDDSLNSSGSLGDGDFVAENSSTTNGTNIFNQSGQQAAVSSAFQNFVFGKWFWLLIIILILLAIFIATRKDKE